MPKVAKPVEPKSKLEDAVNNALLLGVLRRFALLSRSDEVQNLFGLLPSSRVSEPAPAKVPVKRSARGLGLLPVVEAAAPASAAPAEAAAASAAKPKRPTVVITGAWMTLTAQSDETIEPLRFSKAARLLAQRLALKTAADEKLADQLIAAVKPTLDATMLEAGQPHAGYDAAAIRVLHEALGCEQVRAAKVYEFLNGLGGMLMMAGWYRTIGESDPCARVKMNEGDLLSTLALLTGRLPRGVTEIAEALMEELAELARNAQQARLLKAQAKASAELLAAGAAAPSTAAPAAVST